MSADSSSNSIATVKNSSKFWILLSASTVFSVSNAFVYPVLLSVSFNNSDILSSCLFNLNSSITWINSSAFALILFNPFSSACLIISYIELPVWSAICCTWSKLVLPIPLLGSLIILFKDKLSAVFAMRRR